MIVYADKYNNYIHVYQGRLEPPHFFKIKIID